MPHRRQLARLLALPAMLASCAILPSAAGAAVPVAAPAAGPAAAVETTVADVAAPVRAAAARTADALQPASGGVARPGDDGQAHPVADTIAPIAHAATTPVDSTAALAVTAKHLDEHARPRISHIAATSSGQRVNSGRSARSHGPNGATRLPTSEPSAPAHRASASHPDLSATPAASAAPAAANLAPAAAAPGAAAAGGSGGFFSGGGFALLVASLLLAGPCLRRQLAELPVVCRPAAFLVVLERPG